MIDNIMWTEQYRPESLEDLALEEENRKLFQTYLDRGEFPHLLLDGPPGCGKTSVAEILIEGIGAQSLELNTSDQRGIDIVRGKIRTFAQGKGFNSDKKVALLDEADNLTPESAKALRRIMEKYSDNCRFILTCNYRSRIIDAVQSRCQIIEMSEIPKKERFKVLRNILDKEGVEAEGETVLSYAEQFSDMRQMLSAAQRSVLTNDGELQPASTVTIDAEQIFKWCAHGEYGKVRDRTDEAPYFNYIGALEDLFEAIPDQFQKSNTWRSEIHTALSNQSEARNKRLHFLGTCAALISTLE